jgi:2-dehydro-3-deoxy-L-rhamnonate dehydrogenase (NAD+)
MAYENQTICVTGGASGIGQAIAIDFASQGGNICLMDVNAQSLKDTENKIVKKHGVKVISCVVDVTSQENVENAFKRVHETFGRIDVLVQCAGITGITNVNTHEVDVNNFDLVFQINVKGIFLCCRAVLPYMMKQNYGRIVNIASVAGKEGNAGMLAYSTSKAAVIGLTKVMGKEYAETGITVNCIAPAVVQTPMVDAMPDEQVSYMTEKIPMKRTGKLHEISSLVLYVASPKASFTTAFCWDATGGRATY